MSVVVVWYVGVTVALGCVLAVVIGVQWAADRVRGVQRGAVAVAASESTVGAPGGDAARPRRVDLRPPAERVGAGADRSGGELLAAAGGGA